MFDLPFGDITSTIGNVLSGLRNTVFSNVQNPFGGGGSSGVRDPFQGQAFNAASPFQGQQWQVGNPFGGFGVQNPFGQSPWHVANWSQVGNDNPLNQPASSGSGSSGDGSADPNTAKWRPLITEAAQKAGIDPDVVQAIMMIESGGNPDSRSQAGALGLMQVMPFWFKDGENGLDPRTNVMKGAQILADNFKRYGNWDSAVAAYLGAVDANGNPTHAQDANGTDGFAYIQKFHQNLDFLKAHPGGTVSGSGDLNQLASSGVQWAQKAQPLLGVAYTNGGIRETGDPRSGMDCSSFVGYVKGLDRNTWNAQAEYDASQKVAPGASLAQALGQLQPGDLVFFQGTTGDDPSARPVTHVGIYLGGGKMIHTGGSPGVQVVDLNSDYWAQHWYGAGRLG